MKRLNVRAFARQSLHGWKLACATGLLVIGVSSSVLAVETPAVPKSPDLRDAKVPASVPNISGTWYTRGFNPRTKPADGTETPWLPWTKEAFEKREKARKAGAPLVDPTAACLPSGVPRIIASPYPIEIVQMPDMVVFLYEVQHQFRIVYMNAQHPKKVTPSFMGHAVGKWEGDTLVIDTVGLTRKTQVDEDGSLHSEQLHVVERIKFTDDKTLEDRFTIDDPKAYSKPWTAVRNFYFQPTLRFLEYVCEENNRNAPDQNGVLRNF